MLHTSIHLLAQTPEFEWVAQLGGVNARDGFAELVNDITTDRQGNVYVTGLFHDTGDFDPGPDIFSLTSFDHSDIFIGKYSPEGELIWATSLGGAGSDVGIGIAVDRFDNLYITGRFEGTVDFDPGPDTYDIEGFFDCFVLKLDSDGNFIWAKAVGGDGNDAGIGITVDESQNVYTTGTFYNTVDFNPGANTFSLTSNGTKDSFILKLDKEGDFVWVKAIGGTANEHSAAIVLDNFNNIYTTGIFNNTVDFDPGAEEFNLTEIGTDDGDQYILKLNVDGDFIWAISIGGGTIVSPSGIAIDAINGHLYTAGSFRSGNIDFDPGPDTSYLYTNWASDLFISKYDTDGNYIWAKSIGGDTNFVNVENMALDRNNNVYITGDFAQTVDFDPGPGVSSISSMINHDAFIVKLDSDGSYVWAGSFAGASFDTGHAIFLDDSDNIYSAGYFQFTTDFDPSEEVYELSAYGTTAVTDAFLHKMCQNCSTTSIENNFSTTSLKYSIYPNPTNNFLYFDSPNNEDYELALFNILGEEITILDQNESNGKIQIQVSLLSAGTYWLKICRKGKVTWEQIKVF